MGAKQVRWGLVGTGDIANKRVAPALQSLGDRGVLAAVTSRTLPRAEDFADRHKIPRVHESYQQLLEDKDIDAVYLATPVDLHSQMTILAARAGKHVLCEKPMALTYAQCQTMVRACRQAKVRLGVAYYRRFYPTVRTMKQSIEKGSLGDLVYARCLAAEKFNLERSDAPRHWFLEKKRSGGGPMMDFGCHRIDLMIFLVGPVDSAYGELLNIRFTERDVEDHATGLLLFSRPRAGAKAPQGTITATHCLDLSEDQFEIYGTLGKLVVPDLSRGTLHLVTAGENRSCDLPTHANVHFPLIHDFNSAILEDRDPLVTGEEGSKTSRVLDQIYGRL